MGPICPPALPVRILVHRYGGRELGSALEAGQHGCWVAVRHAHPGMYCLTMQSTTCAPPSPSPARADVHFFDHFEHAPRVLGMGLGFPSAGSVVSSAGQHGRMRQTAVNSFYCLAAGNRPKATRYQIAPGAAAGAVASGSAAASQEPSTGTMLSRSWVDQTPGPT